MKLRHIDLFSGIGGFALAAGWAGFKTEVFCEKDEYCQKVLNKHWPEVPIIPDIKGFDGEKWRGAALLTGGFPCQPFSQAGKRKGKEDDRHLWPEMLRVIEEAKPRWVIAENVVGIVSMELGQVLSDLEAIGYDFPRDLQGTPIVPVIPASALNAPHRRGRVWVIAYATGERPEHGKQIPETGKDTITGNARNAGGLGLPGIDRRGAGQELEVGYCECEWKIPWIEVAARFCRMDDGLSAWVYRHRTRRLKALGNAIVPQVAYEIIRGIRLIELGK